MRKVCEHDQIELDAFRRYLSIMSFREKEMGECHERAQVYAGWEVYGDPFCEGNKHHAPHI